MLLGPLLPAASASAQIPALPYVLDQGGFTRGDTKERPFFLFRGAGRCLPAVAGYRGRIVYFNGPEAVVSPASQFPKSFVTTLRNPGISRGFSEARLAVLGETIYAGAFSNRADRTVTLWKGGPDPADPGDPDRIKWARVSASPLPWRPG